MFISFLVAKKQKKPANILLHKDWAVKKVTIPNSTFLIVKSSEMIVFFTCNLLDYVVIESSKNILKKYGTSVLIFENL